MPKLSVIVPVYKVEKYVERCLESIANQTMKDLEIIVINDGSPDNSEEIIKQFIKNNPETSIKYLKKENGGLASARNYGIKQASGKYLSFIDADDYIDVKLYENLEKYMDCEIEMIKFKMQTVTKTGKTIQKLGGPVFEECTGEEAYEKLCTTDKFMDPACIYLYKTEFFKSNNFEYRLTYHEDFGLTSLAIVNSKSFVSTDIYGYYYVQSENSLTREESYEKSKLRANDVLNHYDYCLEKLKNYKIEEKTKELVKKYYTNTVVLKAETLKNEDLEKYIKEIKKRKLYKNIKSNNLKQLIKRNLLKMNIKLYLKMR